MKVEQNWQPNKLESEKLSRQDNLIKKYGRELVDRFLEKELLKTSATKNGLDEGKLGEMYKKLENDSEYAKMVYQAVENKMKSLGAYIRKRETAEMATRDSLTGLLNRHGFNIEIDKRLAQKKRFAENGESERRERNFWIFMFDIDKFKTFNDTYGHNIGDEVLVELGQIIQSELRPNDTAVRMGGEEFIAIVDEGRASQSEILELAERLRTAVEKHKFTKQNLSVTVSVGITRYNEADKDIDKTVNRADGGLYIAKGEESQINKKGLKIMAGQKIPTKEETRNQIWYYDEDSGNYSKYIAK